MTTFMINIYNHHNNRNKFCPQKATVIFDTATYRHNTHIP